LCILIYYCIFQKKTKMSSHFKTIFIFIFLAVLGLELRAFTLSHSTNPFLMGFFQDRVS
jgi:hypothetical protein